MNDLDKTLKDIERDLVISIVLSVKYGRINLKEAKQISKSFVNSFPFEDHKSIFDKLYILSSKYREMRKVYVKYAPIYENEIRNEILKNMRKYMKNNEIDNAIKVAKGGGYG